MLLRDFFHDVAVVKLGSLAGTQSLVLLDLCNEVLSVNLLYNGFLKIVVVALVKNCGAFLLLGENLRGPLLFGGAGQQAIDLVVVTLEPLFLVPLSHHLTGIITS